MSNIRPKSMKWLIALLLAGLGFAVTTQIKFNERGEAFAGLRTAELVQVLNGLGAERKRLEADLAKLSKEESQLKNSSGNEEAIIANAKNELTNLAILAGAVPVTGTGIRITITNNGNTPSKNSLTVNHFLDAIEELRDAGAEAIEINETNRVVAQTYFEQTNNGIAISGKPLSSTYVIEAIGSISNLENAITFAGGLIDDAKNDGATVAYQGLENVEISSVIPAAAKKYQELTSKK